MSSSLVISNHYQHPEIWRKFLLNVKKTATMGSDFKLCLPTISLLFDGRNKQVIWYTYSISLVFIRLLFVKLLFFI